MDEFFYLGLSTPPSSSHGAASASCMLSTLATVRSLKGGAAASPTALRLAGGSAGDVSPTSSRQWRRHSET
jgi:hypothetical protein